MAVRLRKPPPRIPSTRNNEGVDSNVVASAAIGSLGRAEPTTDCVKTPFVSSGVTDLKVTDSGNVVTFFFLNRLSPALRTLLDIKKMADKS